MLEKAAAPDRPAAALGWKKKAKKALEDEESKQAEATRAGLKKNLPEMWKRLRA